MFLCSIKRFYEIGVGDLHLKGSFPKIDYKWKIWEGKKGVAILSCEIWVWGYVRKGWDTFNSRLSFFVGNGRRAKFWKDAWCEEGPLCFACASLFT